MAKSSSTGSPATSRRIRASPPRSPTTPPRPCDPDESHAGCPASQPPGRGGARTVLDAAPVDRRRGGIGGKRGIVSGMSRLKGSKRSRLPDTAFAYIDSRGRRRLPVHDRAHVRNALARFNQVAFENDAARERARQRLLNAAKKYGIVPVGFITGELRSERRHATAGRLVIELGRVGAAGELEDQL